MLQELPEPLGRQPAALSRQQRQHPVQGEGAGQPLCRAARDGAQLGVQVAQHAVVDLQPLEEVGDHRRGDTRGSDPRHAPQLLLDPLLQQPRRLQRQQPQRPPHVRHRLVPLQQQRPQPGLAAHPPLQRAPVPGVRPQLLAQPPQRPGRPRQQPSEEGGGGVQAAAVLAGQAQEVAVPQQRLQGGAALGHARVQRVEGEGVGGLVPHVAAEGLGAGVLPGAEGAAQPRQAPLQPRQRLGALLRVPVRGGRAGRGGQQAPQAGPDAAPQHGLRLAQRAGQAAPGAAACGDGNGNGTGNGAGTGSGTGTEPGAGRGGGGAAALTWLRGRAGRGGERRQQRRQQRGQRGQGRRGGHRDGHRAGGGRQLRAGGGQQGAGLQTRAPPRPPPPPIGARRAGKPRPLPGRGHVTPRGRAALPWRRRKRGRARGRRQAATSGPGRAAAGAASPPAARARPRHGPAPLRRPQSPARPAGPQLTPPQPAGSGAGRHGQSCAPRPGRPVPAGPHLPAAPPGPSVLHAGPGAGTAPGTGGRRRQEMSLAALSPANPGRAAGRASRHTAPAPACRQGCGGTRRCPGRGCGAHGATPGDSAWGRGTPRRFPPTPRGRERPLEPCGPPSCPHPTWRPRPHAPPAPRFRLAPSGSFRGPAAGTGSGGAGPGRAMRGAGGTGPGAALAACPWGCVLGTGGWSGVPPCPLHFLRGAAEAERRMRQVQAACPPLHRTAPGRGLAEPLPGQGLSCPSQPESSEEEEEEEDEEWLDCARGYGSPGFHFHGTNNPVLRGAPLPAYPVPNFLNLGVHGLNTSWRHQVTAEEAEKNAKELVAEEERMKKKAEKKKLKKKKQKDRKKQEKLKQELKSKQEAESNASSLNSAAPGEADGAEEEKGCSASSPSQSLGDDAEEGAGDQGGSVEAVEDELDLSCTFVFKARQKAGVKLQVPEKEKPTQPGAVEPNKGPQETAPEPPLPCLAAPQAPEPVPLDTSVVEQSLVLAGHGNEAAQKGYYEEAVQAFTEAVKLNPREHRLFGNRSYCYEKLQQYEEALRDAQMSLSLQPNWPKGFFRKGKALRGLKRYAEAVRTFEELLRLDGAHPDAAAQLQACRVLLQQSSAHTADGPGGVPVLSLLEDGESPLPEEWVNGSCSDTDMSGFVTVVKSRSHSKSRARATAAASTKQQQQQQQQLPPHHPARDCYPLWVGNITSRITEKVLRDCFSRFGKIQSIRMLPGKHCAFINFKQKTAAEAAYEEMLDADLEGSRLVLQLKHPSHATPSPWQRP